MVQISEQFIQDIVSRPDRLKRMIQDQAVGKTDWFFDAEEIEGDIVNQEYTVGAGRIDVIATFSHRTRLLVVEVKAGVADVAAVEQLKWYLDPKQLATLRTDEQLSQLSDDVIGVVVAQGFSGIPTDKVPSNVHLFRCDLERADSEPQLVRVPPSEVAPLPPPLNDTPPDTKRSQVSRLSAHVNYIAPELREAFKKFTRCCLPEGHDDLRWVHVNAKGEHVAVHYRGVYMICLWARQKWFYVQHGNSPEAVKVTCGLDTAQYEEAIKEERAAIDEKVQKLFSRG